MNEPITTEPKELSIWGYFVRSITTKFATFSGRARRKEFWGTILFLAIISGLLGAIGGGSAMKEMQSDPDMAAYIMQNPSEIYALMGGSLLYWLSAIVSLVLLIPNLAVICRRYHDIGLSSTIFWVINWVPVVSSILGIVLLIMPEPAIVSIFLIIALLAGLVDLINFIIGFIPGKKGPNAYGPDPKPEQVPTWGRTVQ